MVKSLINYLKKEKVLVTAFIIAAATMFFVPPDREYISYIDMRVLCLLLSLMAVVAGFEKCGFFKYLAVKILKMSKNGKILGCILVMLPFFLSMLITNDVSLLTFVPFTLMLLKEANCEKGIIPLLVFETVAANLGSMATPVGNPQNLYLYSAYELSAKEFFGTMVPLTALSFIILFVSSLFLLPKKTGDFTLKGDITSQKKLYIYSLLFILCLLTVFRILPYKVMTLIVLVSIFFTDREILKGLDYALLFTFICFFTVSGNLGRIESVKLLIQNLLNENALLTSAGASQIISNVPAAVLLSNFTDNWKALLEGTNIGGLGTPIASLASLITLKIYLAEKGSKGLKFLTYFLVVNILGLILLLTFAHIF